MASNPFMRPIILSFFRLWNEARVWSLCKYSDVTDTEIVAMGWYSVHLHSHKPQVKKSQQHASLCLSVCLSDCVYDPLAWACFNLQGSGTRWSALNFNDCKAQNNVHWLLWDIWEVDLNPFTLEKWLNECQPKNYGLIWIKVKTMRHILSFSAEPLLRITSQKTGVYVQNLLWW